MNAVASRLPIQLLLALAAAWVAAACSSRPPAMTDAALINRLAAADIVLLGELHDNVVQHRLRLQWLRALSDRVPIALVIEHLDADAQPKLDEARRALDPAQPLPARARQLAEAARFNFEGWDWSLISPVIELALERNLPIHAANLSAREAFSIARGQPHPLASRVPSGWTDAVERQMTASIRDGHCGLMPEAMLPAMVRAQRARDARMADALLNARASGFKPVLLAGNGHVRTDLGVPLHLRDRLQPGAVLSVGLLENPATSDDGPYDEIRVTEAQSRPDPCESLRQRFGGKPGVPR